MTDHTPHPYRVHNTAMSGSQEDTVRVARWATREELAEHLRVSVKTVQRMTSRGELPAPHAIGPRLIRYDLNEIDALLTNGGQVPADA